MADNDTNITQQNTPCPCEAVRDLKALVDKHNDQIHAIEINAVKVDSKLDQIIGIVNAKQKFNSSIALTIINAILTILIGYIAVKLGLR